MKGKEDKDKDSSSTNININKFCNKPSKLKHFYQTVIKRQPWPCCRYKAHFFNVTTLLKPLLCTHNIGGMQVCSFNSLNTLNTCFNKTKVPPIVIYLKMPLS